MDAPVFLLAARDAGPTYYFWQQLQPELSEPEFTVLDRTELQGLLDELRAALPGNFGPEPDDAPVSEKARVERALQHGLLADRDREREYSARLGAFVLDDRLVRQIAAAASSSGQRVTVQLSPGPSLILVPWELLLVPVAGELVRFGDLVYIVTLPGEYADGRAAQPEPWTSRDGTAPVAYVIDPAAWAAKPLLVEEQCTQFTLECARPDSFTAGWSPLPQKLVDIDEELVAAPRNVFGEMLRRSPSRLLYLGHVANSTEQPAATSMLLGDPPSTYGYADEIRGTRPFAAQDWLMGTVEAATLAPEIARRAKLAERAGLHWPAEPGREAAGAEIWPAPKRVAIIACNSGADLSHEEPFGLVTAVVNAGAEYVTATRWTLPGDRAFRSNDWLVPEDPQPLLEMALAVDHAHDADDPIRALSDWMRAKRRAWDTDGNLADSPVLWAALVTYWAPEKHVQPLTEEERAYFDAPAEDEPPAVPNLN